MKTLVLENGKLIFYYSQLTFDAASKKSGLMNIVNTNKRFSNLA